MPPVSDFFFLSFDKVREFINETTTAMIGISNHSCEGMKEFCPKEKIRLIYNGPLDASQASCSLPPKKSVGSPIRVLCVGRSSEAKGHHLAAGAVAKLRAKGIPITLTIAGEIPEVFDRKMREILPEGLNMLGFVNDPTELYRTHDILAMASKQEAFGRVTVEAMAIGCVVVGSASGATPELIGHKVTGLLVQPERGDALADGILELRNESGLYEALRCAAHKEAFARFTRDRYAEEVADLYRKTLRT
jgi:glycosyltransferase involved in cell wall biosynthesis